MANKIPKVSVVVPVYNVEKYLGRCLDSLINQTLEEIQIIVVNDGSTDMSGEILKKYSTKYPNKIIYLEKANGGLSDARNYGIPYASGEYIAFLDSDDYVEPNMYEVMYKSARDNDSDLVECNFIWEYPDKAKYDIGTEYSSKDEMILYGRVVAWNKIIKNKIVKKSGIVYPVALKYEDVEFFLKLVPYIDKVSFIDDAFIHYIQRGASISNNQNEKNADIFKIIKNVLEYYKENDLYEKYLESIEYTCVRILLCSSFRRINKIKNKAVRKRLLTENWNFINENFPEWKINKKLVADKSKKAIYIKSVNKITYRIYAGLFKIIG